MIRVRFFKRYQEVPAKHRFVIQRDLGIPSGIIRELAKRFNAPVTVAYNRGHPIGWAAVLPKGAWRRARGDERSLQIFVRREYRRKKVGSRLIWLLRYRATRPHERVSVDKKRTSVRFYAATGMEFKD